jgi:hypothetical protein
MRMTGMCGVSKSMGPSSEVDGPVYCNVRSSHDA